MLDDRLHRRLDLAWTDLYAAQGHHDIFLTFLSSKFNFDLGGRKAADLEDRWIRHAPAEAQVYLRKLSDDVQAIGTALRAAEPGHLEDLLLFADRAWRRHLDAAEMGRLIDYYRNLRNHYELTHPDAIRTVLARILVAPDFLYRLETPIEQRTSNVEHRTPNSERRTANIERRTSNDGARVPGGAFKPAELFLVVLHAGPRIATGRLRRDIGTS